MTKSILLALAILAAPMVVFAAGGEAHGEGIPTVLWFQVINFAIFVGLLFYFLRKPIRNAFSTREQSYNQAVMRGETARKEAERKKQEIQERLAKLESTSAASIESARAESAALMQQIQKEAQELAQRLRNEASLSAGLEIERAKHELREELLTQAVALSKKVLEEKMAEPDQKRLQTEFVDKIATKTAEVR